MRRWWTSLFIRGVTRCRRGTYQLMVTDNRSIPPAYRLAVRGWRSLVLFHSQVGALRISTASMVQRWCRLFFNSSLMALVFSQLMMWFFLFMCSDFGEFMFSCKAPSLLDLDVLFLLHLMSFCIEERHGIFYITLHHFVLVFSLGCTVWV